VTTGLPRRTFVFILTFLMHGTGSVQFYPFLMKNANYVAPHYAILSNNRCCVTNIKCMIFQEINFKLKKMSASNISPKKQYWKYRPVDVSIKLCVPAKARRLIWFWLSFITQKVFIYIKRTNKEFNLLGLGKIFK
jgi:hypothetical protein